MSRWAAVASHPQIRTSVREGVWDDRPTPHRPTWSGRHHAPTPGVGPACVVLRLPRGPPTQDITNPADVLILTAEAIRHVAPHYVLIVGICYRLRPKDGQKIGDVLVLVLSAISDHACRRIPTASVDHRP
jgi:hypothetical protein